MALKFNYKKMMSDYITYFMSELDIALKAWEIEVKSGINSNFANSFSGGKTQKIPRAWVNSYVEYHSKVVKGFLEANTVVLADSYGTGSLMLEDNPGLAEYKRSGLWNKDRKGNYITGREAGDYTDLFSRPRHTSGTFKGKILEGRKMNNGFVIKPIPPSKSLQNAEMRLYKTYLPRALKNAIDKIKISNYIIEVDR